MFKQKRASRDFNKADLPSNRKEVFFDRFKNQYGVFFKTGLTLFLFFIPFLIVGFLKDYSLWYHASRGDFSIADYNQMQILYALIKIPVYIIIALGCAGSFRVMKNLAWEIPVFFKEDFLEGIKKNAKSFIVVFVSFSVISVLCELTLTASNIPELVRYLPSGILVGLVLPMALTSLNIFNLYNATFLEACKLSLRFFFGKTFKSILALLGVCAPFLILLINNFVIKYILFIPVVIFILPCSILTWFLYCCYLFDYFMNKNTYPEIYDKGVYRK
ncbi:MAG: hypothetical protein ACOX3K_02420 [Bacilli bacterium]